MKFSVRIVPSKSKITKYTRVYIYSYFYDTIKKTRVKTKVEVVGNYLEQQALDPDFLQKAENRAKELQKEYEDFIKSNNYYKFNKKSVETSSVCSWGEALLFPIWKKLGLHKFLSQTYNSDVSKTAFALVAYRFINPTSKLETFNNLDKSLFNYEFIDRNDIYEVLNKIAQVKDRVIGCINRNIDKHFERNMSIVLYDVTTFYFESFKQEPDIEFDQFDQEAFFNAITATLLKNDKNVKSYLRARGFSKENKHYETQIVLGMLVDADGIPFTYEIFRGNTAETHTLLLIVEKFKRLYKIDKVIVVADSGLNSSNNIKQLEDAGYEYIVGFPPHMKLSQKEGELILSPENWRLVDTHDSSIRYKETFLTLKRNHKLYGKYQLQAKLITYFSENMRLKRLDEIDKKSNKAQNLIDKNTIPNANNYIKLTNKKKTYKINERLIQKQKLWAGYTGILTNIYHINPMHILNLKQCLWKIEDNFRVLKTNLKIRPVFVYKDDHVKGHVLACYIALVIVRFIQKMARDQGYHLSSDMIIDVIRNRNVTPFVDDQGNKLLLLQHNTRLDNKNNLTSLEDENYNFIVKTLGMKLGGGLITLSEFYNEVGSILLVHPKHFINDVKREGLSVQDFIDSFYAYVQKFK